MSDEQQVYEGPRAVLLPTAEGNLAVLTGQGEPVLMAKGDSANLAFPNEMAGEDTALIMWGWSWEQQGALYATIARLKKALRDIVEEPASYTVNAARELLDELDPPKVEDECDAVTGVEG